MQIAESVISRTEGGGSKFLLNAARSQNKENHEFIQKFCPKAEEKKQLGR
jgi:hypothetical protein